MVMTITCHSKKDLSTMITEIISIGQVQIQNLLDIRGQVIYSIERDPEMVEQCNHTQIMAVVVQQKSDAIAIINAWQVICINSH
jgi:hypothetical protein